MQATKKYLTPISITEASLMMEENENDFCLMAGGTDLMVNKFQGNETSSCIIDLTRINEMKEVVVKENYLSIGALVCLDDLKKHEIIQKEFSVLIEAAASVASPVIRKTATLGGNILCENRCIYFNQSEWWRDAVGLCLKCNGSICIATGSKKNCYSEFVSDTAPALISMNALIEVIDKGKEMRIKLEDIFTGDGVCSKKLNKTSIIKSILLPLNQEFTSVFIKLRQRESMDFSSLTSVVTKDKANNIRIVLGAVDPKPVIVDGDINSDIEDLIKKSLLKSRAIDNEMFSRNYRREMIAVFLKRSFSKIIG